MIHTIEIDSSGAPVHIGDSVAIVKRPEETPFRLDRIEIEDSSNWIVCDLKIGNKSLMRQTGDIPGDLFDNDSIHNFVRVGTKHAVCRAFEDIVIVASYIGVDPDGSIFKAKLHGEVPSTDRN